MVVITRTQRNKSKCTSYSMRNASTSIGHWLVVSVKHQSGKNCYLNNLTAKYPVEFGQRRSMFLITNLNQTGQSLPSEVYDSSYTLDMKTVR